MFRTIGDIWQENDIVKNSRYGVELNYVEIFLIQLRMPVIFTGLSTGSGNFMNFLILSQLSDSVDVPSASSGCYWSLISYFSINCFFKLQFISSRSCRICQIAYRERLDQYPSNSDQI